MKTKHILTAMVLPTLLAACTADEIVENNNVNLDGVAKLNPITFTMGENADSRLLWDNTGLGNWKWGAEGDQFSAFLVSAGIAQPVQDLLLTNYVYSISCIILQIYYNSPYTFSSITKLIII